MVSILILAVLFLFITVNLGFLITRYFAKTGLFHFNFFGVFLTGIATLTVYLNILSLFIATDFKLLMPLFLLSILNITGKQFLPWIRTTLVHNAGLLFRRRNAIITVSFIIVILLFTVVPPYNTDSSGYHFLAIKWNEQFSIVPGLANLFPQFGYNSSFMVLSAAFSFTSIFKESIYPLNVVITLLFFCWMLKKSFGYNPAGQIIVLFILFVFLRQMPINLASPSADTLASVLVFYILYSVFETDDATFQYQWKGLFILACLAVIIKLSAVPLLLVACIPLLQRPIKLNKIIADYLVLLPVVLVTVVPWLIRNVMLSGYLIFPFPQLDIFDFDWKVPYDVVFADQLHISQGAKMAGDNWLEVSRLHLYEWIPLWLPNLWMDNHFNFILVVAGMFSPVIFIVLRKKVRLSPSFLVSCSIALTGIWFWLMNSPDIRFGYHYLLVLLTFPLLYVVKNSTGINSSIGKGLRIFTVLIAVAGCCYFGSIACGFLQSYSIGTYIVKPLKSAEYTKNNDMATFKYVLLNNSVKLYIHDSLHHSINAPLPSCSPYRAGIGMRGNNLQDGFKTLY